MRSGPAERDERLFPQWRSIIPRGIPLLFGKHTPRLKVVPSGILRSSAVGWPPSVGLLRAFEPSDTDRAPTVTNWS